MNMARISPVISPLMSPRLRPRGALSVIFGALLPNRESLVFYTRPLIDSIGNSTLTVTDGAGGDFVDMTFTFPYTTDMQDIDTDLGGGVLFTGATPISRTWAEWFALTEINVDFLWIGQRGVAGYSTDQSANSAQIISVLRCVAPESAGFPYTFPFELG